MSSNIFIKSYEYQESIEKKIQSIPPTDKRDMQKILQKIVETSIQNRETRGEKSSSLFSR